MKVLITGGARGLGRAMVEEFRTIGAQIIAVDLNCDPLQGLDDVQSITIDLTQRGAVDRIRDQIGDTIDVLIHAAGISAAGAFDDLPWAQQQHVWDINFAAPIRLTQTLLGSEHLSPDARICFVASLSCFVGYPGAASYAGSKDGLASYARSLNRSAIAQNMSVSVAYPGPIRTDHAARYAPDNSDQAVARRMPPQQAAKLIIADIQRGRRTILPGMGAKVAAMLGRVAPGLMGKIMRKAIFEKMSGSAEKNG